MKQAVIVLIINNRRNVLTVSNRHHGDIYLPGGEVDEGESLEDAAIRELKEKTNLTVFASQLIPLAVGASVVDPTQEVTVFYACAVSGTATAVEADTMMEWMKWESLVVVSPFRRLYEKCFPKGIDHLKHTKGYFL